MMGNWECDLFYSNCFSPIINLFWLSKSGQLTRELLSEWSKIG